MKTMTSNQPYLLRAFYDWLVDNDLTPYIVVDAHVEGTQVPQQHVKDGQIVLNVSPSACANFTMDNQWLGFDARFGGVPMRISVPCVAVLAIYARENGAGTIFTPEESGIAERKEDKSADSSSQGTKPQSKGKPNLKVVK